MAIINIGLLGPGKIAKRVADGIISADNANLYAIGSRNINRAREFAKDYHAIAYENEELLKDKNVDAVYIAIPNAYHFEWIMKSLQAGKHVICEKPIFVNEEECEKAFTLAKEKRLMLMEAMKSDFLPLTLKIKDSYYSIDTLVDNNIMNEYKSGYALVFRLSTDNYHRYCYIDSGTKGKNIHIDGVFHTVQPIALKHYNFYKTNTREYTVLDTNNFDKVIQVEVGAMGIGKIVNNHQEYKFKKGEEKGYFEFGGSTIVVLVKKDIITIDEDIYSNSLENIETNVKYGERIGIKK